MVNRINRMSAPFYAQFELTEACNNKCFFCYNPLGKMNGLELSTDKIKDILKQLSDVGVFRINFNGGEPMARKDLHEIIEYAASLGFELHMNTNSTLVNDEIAEFISSYMKSVCTSILHSKREVHDRMTGRIGAYDDVLRGIHIWRRHNVKVEINVCTCSDNYQDIYNIGRLAAENDCYALCSTRYILTSAENQRLLLDANQTMELVDLLMRVKQDFPSITDVSLPGPVPYCELPVEYREALRVLNIPCQYAYGLVRISPSGKVTPCTISNDEIGDLNCEDFKTIWNGEGWKKYEGLCHLPVGCRDCEELQRCKGGCVVYDESIRGCGFVIDTKKWRNYAAQ